MKRLAASEPFRLIPQRRRLITLCRSLVSAAILVVVGMTDSFAADVPLANVLPFSPPRTSELRNSPRQAFAHWHVYPVSIDNLDPSVDWYQQKELSPLGSNGEYYDVGGRMRQRPLPRPVRLEPKGVWEVRDMEDEIRRAIAVGLDGFTCGVCTLPGGICWRRLETMLQAVSNVDPEFKVIPNLDMASLRSAEPAPTVNDIAEALAQISNAPALKRMDDGRLVISATNPHNKPATWWSSLRQAFASRGIDVYFLLILQAYGRDFDEYMPVADALGFWGQGTPGGSAATADRVASLRQAGKMYVVPVRSQDFRPKNAAYSEARGSATFVATMTDAISSDADWLHILTWNDGEEGGEIRPSTGVQWSFYDLAAYYLTWFKMRQPPLIKRDVLYYFHRIHRTTTPPDPTKQPAPFTVRNADLQQPVDEIELLAFLRSPGTLRITTSAGSVSTDAPAGVTSVRTALADGYPRFTLVRSGVTRITMRSAFNVRDRIDWQDLLYRGGSSTRPVVEMVADPPVVP